MLVICSTRDHRILIALANGDTTYTQRASDGFQRRKVREDHTHPISKRCGRQFPTRASVYFLQPQALWDSVQAWFNGGPAASGKVDPACAVVHAFPGRGGATWKIYPDGTSRDAKTLVDWTSFATPYASERHTFGYRWNSQWVKQDASANGRGLVVLPEYYRQDQDEKQRPIWTPIAAAEVPAETGLAEVSFERQRNADPKTYVTPEDADSSWKKPGPKAGPFKAYPGDGSVITYYWYRFADQPALLNADMTANEREEMQQRVETLHRHWTKEREYLAPPSQGQLAISIQPCWSLPPQGLEIGTYRSLRGKNRIANFGAVAQLQLFDVLTSCNRSLRRLTRFARASFQRTITSKAQASLSTPKSWSAVAQLQLSMC